jgi:tetratricopeptide (TPR) repeat protein
MPEGPPNLAPKWAAAIVASIGALWLCYAGGKHALASYYGASPDFQSWERGAQIEPDNPEAWYRLGRFRQLDFDNADISQAIAYYRRAEQLNPQSPFYKLDLASALEIAGDGSEADAEFRAAQSAYPISPEVSWKYGNFLLRQNRLPEAFAEIRRALTVDSSLLPLAVSRVWHSDPDIYALLDQVLPSTSAAYEQALTFLSDTKDSDAALEVWNRLIATDPHADMKWVFKLTDLLVAQEKFEKAAEVWRRASQGDPATLPAYAGNSLVFDGSFERDISDGGLGWREKDVEGAAFDFDNEVKRSGNRSARLTFDGTKNLAYGDLLQYVLVSPDTRYHFEGFLRTEQISTESGVRFEIQDPNDPRHLDALTPNVIGTMPWTPQEIDFTTGTDTHIVALRLARRPSDRLDNKLRGTVWIDDVAIVPADGDSTAGVAARSHRTATSK